MATDITSRDDIAILVKAFYEQALYDEILFASFTHLRTDKFLDHLPNICDFWEKTLLHTGNYSRNPLVAHRKIHEEFPFTTEHFLRWLQLWIQTVEELFDGTNAFYAKRQAVRIAWSLHRRILGSISPQIDNLLEQY